jgi:uridine kinase
MSAQEPIVIGVAGGTGSGKTTVSERILAQIGVGRIAYLQHDSYYYDNSHLPPEERARRNYDHPASLDTTLLVQHLRALRRGEAVNVPLYDFATHTRLVETRSVAPARVVLVEGILIFAEKDLRDLMDIRIYVDTDADIRFIRRFDRDVKERGRTPDSIIQQYLTTVRPMHLEFVEPSKRYADVIVPEGGHNQVAMEMILARVRSLLAEDASICRDADALNRSDEGMMR